MKPNKINAGHVELAVVALIGYRQHTIVPNVSWGFGLNHECDLLVMDSRRRLTEIEIKVSKSDLRADFKKNHGHESRHISRLVYAVPEEMLELTMELVPQHCGIISVKTNNHNDIEYYTAHWVRKCVHDKKKEPISIEKAMKLMELGLMRIWSLKAALRGARNDVRYLRENYKNTK